MEQHGTPFLDKFDRGLTFLKFRLVLWLIDQVSRHRSCKQLEEVVVLLIVVHRSDWWLVLHQYGVSSHSNGIRVRLKVSSLSGLGLLEYLYWCEDLEMQPIMAVWAGEWYRWNVTLQYIYLFPGYSLSGQSLPENELAPYIQQAIDQVWSYFDLRHLVLTATNSFRWTSWLETLLKAKLVHLFLLSFNLCLDFLSCTTSIARPSRTIHIKLCWNR